MSGNDAPFQATIRGKTAYPAVAAYHKTDGVSFGSAAAEHEALTAVGLRAVEACPAHVSEARIDERLATAFKGTDHFVDRCQASTNTILAQPRNEWLATRGESEFREAATAMG